MESLKVILHGTIFNDGFSRNVFEHGAMDDFYISAINDIKRNKIVIRMKWTI